MFSSIMNSDGEDEHGEDVEDNAVEVVVMKEKRVLRVLVFLFNLSETFLVVFGVSGTAIDSHRIE